MAKSKPIRVTVWNEFRHEKHNATVKKVYPRGMHTVIANHLNKQIGITAKCAWLDQPEHGLTEAVLKQTDVLTWWGHGAHNEVSDEVVERIWQHVIDGMGIILLHSSHFSKIFKRLMGTPCGLLWREMGEKERLWVVDAAHPIADGLGRFFELPHTEMYGEQFGIPQPDELVFISWFAGGEVFRSGCCWHRGRGRVFYFRPGHETYPIFKDRNVQRVITNAVRWCVGGRGEKLVTEHHPEPLEKLK